MLPPTEVTKLKAGMVDAKDEAPLAPKEEAPKPKAVAAPSRGGRAATPPPPEPKAKARGGEEARAGEGREAQGAGAEEGAAEKGGSQARQAEGRRPTPKTETKRDFNTDRIAALLNKIPDAAHEPNADAMPVDTPRKPVHGQSNGTQMTMSVNEIDALRARIAQCWSPPPGGLGADAIIVKLRLKLNEDGSLIGYPSIANSGSSPFFQAAADSAVRAVFQCQPYALPGEKYAVWRDMILTFDPRQMYSSG